MTDGINLVWSAAYRPRFWALGFTGVRLSDGLSLTSDRAFRLNLYLEGGIGAGIGGASCVTSSQCAQVGDGPRWYEGVAYGGYIGAGAGLLSRWASLFFSLRVQAEQASSIPSLYRYIGSVGVQIPLPESFNLYLTGGYLMDWDDEVSTGGAAVELGFHRPLSLFRRAR